tara:strand:- start:656 stop:1180 length:525 start_codon:yes stop_codon:yes gene_type:complete
LLAPSKANIKLPLYLPLTRSENYAKENINLRSYNSNYYRQFFGVFRTSILKIIARNGRLWIFCRTNKNIPIPLNLDTVKIDQKLKINGGSLLLSNLKNDRDPQLIKTNNSGNIIWAIAFSEDSIDFPHKKLSEMELDTCFSGYCLSFFNNSFGEPGTIHLDSNYNFLYMCLKPF